jgi:hypothetical protein
MSSFARVLVALACLVVGCAPSQNGVKDGGSGGDDSPLDGDGAPLFIDSAPIDLGGSVSGTVWAPGNSPSQVKSGQEIPIAGAVIYASLEKPEAHKDSVYCQTCQDNPGGAVVSDAKGHFTLPDVPTGTVWITIDKAQFRITQQVQVSKEFALMMTEEQTTLPSKYDPAHGLYIPRVAIAAGDSDHVEDIFGKMKILKVDAKGSTIESSLDDTDHVDIYGNVDVPALPDDPGDSPFKAHHKGTIAALFGNLATMEKYHIIFVPCNYQSDVTPLNNPKVRQNIQKYISEGGHLYVTDWSAEWEDAAFPDFIQFDQGGGEEVSESHDTTKAMADSNSVNAGDGDFGHFAVHGKAEDPGLREWLNGQKGPLITPLGGEDMNFPSSYHDGTINADDFVIEGAWDMIRKTPDVTIGTNEDGTPNVQHAKTWITGEFTEKDAPITTGRWPHTVTFEPSSCGRVLYSTYHTAEKTHPGLMAQERVLLYLILELGVCSNIPPVD